MSLEWEEKFPGMGTSSVPVLQSMIPYTRHQRTPLGVGFTQWTWPTDLTALGLMVFLTYIECCILLGIHHYGSALNLCFTKKKSPNMWFVWWWNSVVFLTSYCLVHSECHPRFLYFLVRFSICDAFEHTILRSKCSCPWSLDCHHVCECAMNRIDELSVPH